MIAKILSLCIPVSLAGCATYREPVYPPIAHLSVLGSAGYVSVGYSGQCGEMHTVPSEIQENFKIRGETTVYLSTNPNGPHSPACTGALSFKAQSGSQYQIYAAIIGQGECAAILRKRNFDNSPWQPDPSLKILERVRCSPW